MKRDDAAGEETHPDAAEACGGDALRERLGSREPPHAGREIRVRGSTW
jgi:hypothetical protein